MKLKKWAALAVLAVMLFSLTGCVGNFYEKAGTINGTEISSGLYLMAQYNAFTEARTNEAIDAEKDIFKQKIDGVSVSDWIKTRTEELLRRYVAVRTLARERGLELDATGQENMQQMTQYWTYLEPSYTANGISVETFERYLTADELSRQLFQTLFAEGGELAVPDADLKKEYGEKYVHVRAYSIPLNALDETLDVHDEVLAMVEKLPGKMQAGMTMEEMVAKELPAIYKVLGREFNPETSADSIYSNFIPLAPEDFETYSEAFLATLKGQQVGDFGVYNMGNTALVYEVVPTFADDEEFAAERDNVITRLKKDVYDEFLRGIYSQYEVEFLPFVRTYFRPSAIKEV